MAYQENKLYFSVYHAVTAGLVSKYISKFMCKNIAYITFNKILLEIIDVILYY